MRIVSARTTATAILNEHRLPGRGRRCVAFDRRAIAADHTSPCAVVSSATVPCARRKSVRGSATAVGLWRALGLVGVSVAFDLFARDVAAAEDRERERERDCGEDR